MLWRLKRAWTFMLAEPELVVFFAAAVICCICLLSGCGHRSLRNPSAPCHSFVISPDGKSWMFQGGRECDHDPELIAQESIR